MLKQYLDRFSWVDFLLKVFQVAAVAVLIVGIFNSLGAAKYTPGQ